MYLDVISGCLTFLGFVFLIVMTIYWIAFGNTMDNLRRIRKEATIEVKKELMRVPIKKTKLFIPLCLFMWLLASIVPSPQTLFKIVALKYGTDAVFSQEAKNLGNKIYESMNKSLSLLNQKLDEYNKSAKGSK